MGKSLSNSSIVASMISVSDLLIQLVLPPAIGLHGAKTSSIILFVSSLYSLQVVLMSA